MSTTDVTETKKSGYIDTWKKYPFEVKVMDMATVIWFALSLVNIILYLVQVEVTMRTFAAFFLPIFMVVVTFSLRLKLIEKPELTKNIFITWAILFGLMVIASVLILIFYPPLS
ncbi:MAG: hypothetical protein ACTSO7_10625 [Candidatus Heimdallarchaeota archaeon]